MSFMLLVTVTCMLILDLRWKSENWIFLTKKLPIQFLRYVVYWDYIRTGAVWMDLHNPGNDAFNSAVPPSTISQLWDVNWGCQDPWALLLFYDSVTQYIQA